MKRRSDRDFRFHEKWIGFAQPIEGLVFSVPVLADAQIAPEVKPTLSTSFEAHLDETGAHIRDLARFFREFLGYDRPGMLVASNGLPAELSFYAREAGEEIRPAWALGAGPFAPEDPFAAFDGAAAASVGPPQYFALILEVARDLDLDARDESSASRYSPTQKLERLLRHVGIAVGFLFNGRELRLVYAPAGETTGHLTFRVEHMQRAEGRDILAALQLLVGAARAYTAAPEHTLEGLLRESRRRQADVTEKLAEQVFEAVEILVHGFADASSREDRTGWLSAALREEHDHFYQGVLSFVLRLVFILYAEDQGLLPMEREVYANHLSVASLHAQLVRDAGAHPESMHHRFGAYGQLLSLFRAVFFGVKHRGLDLPPRRGHLFDPNTYPFLEGGLPEWTAAVVDPTARAAVTPPTVDDGTVFRVLDRLVMFEGQRLSYRTLDVEQIGSVYESLMGYDVRRVESAAVRIGKQGVWVQSADVRTLSTAERMKLFKEKCGLNPSAAQNLESAIKAAKDDDAIVTALCEHALGRDDDLPRHRVEKHRLVVQPGEERRRTGSHYTPRSLTEKVVQRTLEPLLACLGPARTVDRILQLKICDPAMGSGAFLVAACRAIASEVVDVWTRDNELARVIEEHGNAHLHARRLVAQKCLYGVDKNAAAVELAKLSLWLITLSRTLPFTFVDHALRHGDSLVGLDFRQIEAFHWAPSKQLETCAVLLRDALDQAVELRQQILALADHEDVTAQAEKRRLFEFSQQAIDRVRVVADACVGAFFAETKDAARERERTRRLALVERWLAGNEDAGGEVKQLAMEARKKLVPFHWWIEFPEVFFQERPDPLQDGEVNGAALMEAVVGNPPFGGKNVVTDGNVPGYLDWLLKIHETSHGNSDLSAHFFRRAAALLGAHGAFGMVATKTIAEGDTRATGLEHLVRCKWQIYDATVMMKWPGPANVTVSIVHLASGRPCDGLRRRLDGKPVEHIDTRLDARAERAAPSPLMSNRGAAMVGTFILNNGFIVAPAERDALVAADPSNAARLFPLLGGKDLTTSPVQAASNFVISFGDMTVEQASAWPSLLQLVRERVKPARDSLKDNADGRRRKKLWWQFGRWTPTLYEAIRALPRCLVTCGLSEHHVFAWATPDQMFTHNVVVFPLATSSSFAILQSRVHIAWAQHLSSGLEDRGGYRPSDCFGTFAFPEVTPGLAIASLESIGEALYESRAKYMVDTDQGLTKTYNALKDSRREDPRILELRRMHEDLDRAVLAAYGWSNIPVPAFCPMNDGDREAIEDFEDEVIDRLYLLNEQRAREEARLGTAPTTASTEVTVDTAKKRPAKRAPKKGAKKDQGNLF